MKDKILEIISKYKDLDCYYDFLEDNKEKALENKASLENIATEIADMGKDFTEWKDLETIVQRQTRYTVKYLLLDLDAPPDLMTLDELFDYWYDNIYKSTDK